MSNTDKAASVPSRKRGKMYWKFATLEGWRAKDGQDPNTDQPGDSENSEDQAKRTESAATKTDGPSG